MIAIATIPYTAPSMETGQSGLVLLLHQVQAIQWLAVLSKLETDVGIRDDETGLRNTIIALPSLDED